MGGMTNPAPIRRNTIAKPSGVFVYFLSVASVHGLALLAVLYTVTWFALSFEKIFADFGTKLPVSTVTIINLSYFLRCYWPLMLLAIPILLCTDAGMCWFLHRIGGCFASLAWSTIVLAIIGIAGFFSLAALWLPFDGLVRKLSDSGGVSSSTTSKEEHKTGNPTLSESAGKKGTVSEWLAPRSNLHIEITVQIKSGQILRYAQND